MSDDELGGEVCQHSPTAVGMMAKRPGESDAAFYRRIDAEPRDQVYCRGCHRWYWPSLDPNAGEPDAH